MDPSSSFALQKLTGRFSTLQIDLINWCLNPGGFGVFLQVFLCCLWIDFLFV